MKKLFSVLLAAVLAAGTMVLPTAAADGDIVYLQTFDNVASYDDLGWEIVESLTTNTSTYTVENGALTVDNLGGNDSYTVVVPASVMDEVNKGDYTVGYDFTLLESGDTARYLAMLLNYDREVGNTYNSLHMRMKGYADWQNRFVGTWSANMDTNGGYQGLPLFTAKDDGAISNRLFGLAYTDAENVIAGKTIRYEMRVSNTDGYCEIYMNGVLISGTDEAGWDQFCWASEDYSEICLKSGGSILGTVDNIVVAKGLGIPEGTLPAMEGGASAAALPAAEYISLSVVDDAEVIDDDTTQELGGSGQPIQIMADYGCGYSSLGDMVVFNDVDFGANGAASAKMRFGYGADDGSKTLIEFYIDKPEGTPASSVEVGFTGGWEIVNSGWVDVPLSVPAGTHTIYIKFANEKSGSVSELTFTEASAPAAEAVPAAPVQAEGELQNLCLGATVTEVSGLETEGANLGEAAIDGDTATRWSSNTSDDAHIIVDLGTPVPVGYVEIHWETACAQDYTIETSSDGTSWEVKATVTGNTKGTSPWSEDCVVVHEWDALTARFIKINCTKRNTEWGNSIWEIVARKAADTAAVTAEASAYPSSGTEVPEGSVIINGTLIGLETGWGGNAATGRDAAFDGDVNTFFDPLGTGDGYCGVDAGEEMILTKVLIHPRDAQLPRFNGATIEGANEEDFSDAVMLYMSVEEAGEFAWIDVTDELEEADNTGYRYFRYINYTNHGDVAEVELYGKAVDGTNPGAAAPAEEVVEEEPAPAPVVEETPAEEPAPAPEVVEEPEEVVEAPAEEVVEEVEAPAPVEETVEEAPQTFDFGVIAAISALVSLAGFTLTKKR